MGFEVAYDPGENIKIVKAVEKYPVLYDAKKYPAIEFRGVSDKAWALVAEELGVSVIIKGRITFDLFSIRITWRRVRRFAASGTISKKIVFCANINRPPPDKPYTKFQGYCKQRWTNIRGCFKRYLRNKAASTSTKTYYLAEYLKFMLPFMSIDNRLTGRNVRNEVVRYNETSNGSRSDDMDVSNEFELKLVDSDGEEESYFISTNSTSSDEVLEPESERDPDWDFFSSLLPDVKRMTPKQKVKFRNALLGAIDTALYGEDF